MGDEDFVGSWTIAEESSQVLKDLKIDESEDRPGLTINPDMTFVLSNIPDCAFDSFGQCHGLSVTIRGQSMIYRASPKTGLKIHFQSKDRDPNGIVYSYPIMVRDHHIFIGISLGEQRPPIFLIKN